MEKICIVNLRKKTINPMIRNEPGGAAPSERDYRSRSPWPPPHAAGLCRNDAQGRSPDRSEKKEFTAGNVSLALTPEQTDALRMDPYLISFLRREFSDASGETVYRGEPIIIKVAWETPVSVRLLKPQEVLQMLRIGKGCLTEILRSGRLKSYTIGSRKRFRLDDVLSFLEENRDDPNQEPPDTAPGRHGSWRQSKKKEV